jgi:hypothetical protein
VDALPKNRPHRHSPGPGSHAAFTHRDAARPESQQFTTASSRKAEDAGNRQALKPARPHPPTNHHQENTMTLQTERPAIREATTSFTTKAPRGGSYVTVPGNRHDTPRTEGTYVSLPGGHSGNGEKVRGRYVTLHAAPLDETEGSYTRRG